MSRSLSDIISSVPITNRWKLDQEIDFEHRDIRGRVVPQHLGIIAESMIDWEGVIADLLGLTEADRSDIKESNLNKPKLQRYCGCPLSNEEKITQYDPQERGIEQVEI